MKKLIAISAIVFLAASCEEKKKTETTMPAPSETAADARAKEIADSTKMLDEKLANPNDPHTPDSLK